MHNVYHLVHLIFWGLAQLCIKASKLEIMSYYIVFMLIRICTC